MLASVPILLGWLTTVLACYSAGTLLLRALPILFFREEQHFFRFVGGAACFSLLTFGLTAAHLAYEAVFLVACATTTGAALFLRERGSKPIPLPDYSLGWKIVFWVPFTVYGVYYFVQAFGPEYSPDGATYHLGLVGRYLRQHSFGHITNDIYANLSEGIEMLFLVAYSIGKHSAAALVEFSFLLALPWGMLSYARRIGHPKAGVFGGLLVFASPVFGMSGTIAYNDAAGACILFALFYLLQIWSETRQHRLVPLVGLMAGFCYAAKYTLFLALPFAGLFLLWKLWRARQAYIRPALVYTFAAMLLAGPWMVKNWMTVDNPFSPFANRLFPNRYVTIDFEREYSELMRTRDGLTLQSRPFDHIVSGEKSSGLLGPVFLLSPLALLALRFRPGRQLLLAAAVFILPAYTNVETRFLMAMAPFLALSLGLSFAAVPYAAPVILAFHLLTSWPSNIQTYSSRNAWRLAGFSPAEAFRLIPESQTLLRHMPEFAIAQLIEQATPASARIFCYSNPPEAYTSREIVVKYESAFGNLLGEMLWTAANPAIQPNQALSFHFDPVDVRRLRVVETAHHKKEMWSVTELRAYNGRAELPADKTWTLRASVNPWDLALAFDGNPATRWSTVEPIRPGMYLEVDFGRPRELTSVVLESKPEWAPRVRLEYERAAGKWGILSNSPEIRAREPSGNPRAYAVAELKLRGITHLLIDSEDFAASDFFARQQDWGIQFVGEAHGSRLYRVL